MNKNKIAEIVCVVFVVIIAVIAVHAHAPVATPPVSILNVVSYSCDGGKTIIASSWQGENKPAPSPDQPPVPNGNVGLTFSDGRKINLDQTISADGTRYANSDESFVFWSKGNGAMVLEDGAEKNYKGCVMVAPEPEGSSMSQVYSNGAKGFSIRYPVGFTVDESYTYQNLGLDNGTSDISGVKFTIPKTFASGINLGSAYVSVEEIPKLAECSASAFISYHGTLKTVTDNGTTYSVGISGDAAAGSRYDETVYAIPGTNPCIAVRYFVHYGVIDNYSDGTVEFDEPALIARFDQIRRTLVVNQ